MSFNPHFSTQSQDKPSLSPQLQTQLDPTANKVAVLVTNEFVGFTKNGGIGTYYTTLSQKLKEENWTVILVLCHSEITFKGESPFASVHHVFSTQETPNILTLPPHHQQILTQTPTEPVHHSFEHESYAILFLLEAFCQHFPDAVIYAEFPEIWGFGYHTIQAKQTGLLPPHCLIGVTAHGTVEWLREGNQQYFIPELQWVWQAYHYERFSFEKANLVCTPSHFLAHKLKEYGYKTDHAQHLPYFIPLLPSLTDSASTDKISLVFFGRLEARKGLLTFVEAVHSLPKDWVSQLRIIFLGRVVQLQAPHLSSLNSQQYLEQELGHLDLHIESQLSREEAFEYLSQLDSPVVCLTSPQDNFPNTGLEMGQCPVSLVVADAAGWRETLSLVQRQEGVYWFPPDHSDGLCTAIVQALQNRQKRPSVADRETLQQVNQSLLNQRLEMMSQAFLANAPKAPETPTVAVAFWFGEGQEALLDSLKGLTQQTYEKLEIFVLSPKTEAFMTPVGEAQEQFPDVKFITTETYGSRGQAYNELVGQIDTDYILPLMCGPQINPQALATLVSAITHAEASIALSTAIPTEEQITLIDGNLLNLLEFSFSHDLTALFKTEFLQQFPYSTEPHLHALNWQLFAAALATDTAIAYYPYPLYCIHANTLSIPPQDWPKERYYLRQHLTQIDPQRWHKRQIHLLLTGFEQLRQTPPVTSQPTLRSKLPHFSTNTPQDKAWRGVAEELYQEFIQLEQWHKELLKGKDWLDSQWQSWLLRAQKSQWEWQQRETVLEEIQKSKFWKLRNKWFRFQQKLGRISSDPLQPLPQSHQTPGVQEFISRIAGQKLRFFQPQPTQPPLVSIISTCFDEYYSLETTYRTVVNQTLPQFEWLIVDDGSTVEDIKTLLTTLSQRTEKIRIISQPLHQGKAKSYNRAVAQAQGKYLCFLNIGSILDPTYLEKGVLFLESHPQHSLVNSYSIVFQGQEHWWTASLSDPQRILSQGGMWSHPLYRLKDFTALGGFDESLQWYADWERCLKSLSQQQQGGTIPEFLDGYCSTEQTTPTLVLQQFEAAKAEIQEIQSRYWETPHLHPTDNHPQTSPSEQLQFNFNFPLSPKNPVEAEKRLLLFCPNLDNNDLGRWNCELAQQLTQQNYEIVIATTSSGDHILTEFFYPATPEIFHFPHLSSPSHWLGLTRYLITSRQINSLLISGGEMVYYFLPLLRAEFPQLALLDYQHSEQNSLPTQLLQQFSQSLDYQLVASHHQVKAFQEERGNNVEKSPKLEVCDNPTELITVIDTAIHSRQNHSLLHSTVANKQEVLSFLSEYLQQPHPEPSPPVHQPVPPSEPSMKELLKLLVKKIIQRV